MNELMSLDPLSRIVRRGGDDGNRVGVCRGYCRDICKER